MKKILIIEDNAEDMFMLKSKFSHEHFVVIEAKDADEGLVQALEHRPDLILLDLILRDEEKKSADGSEYSGMKLLDELKHNIATSNIPVVVVTNLGHGAPEERAKRLGAEEYLVKAEILPDAIVHRVEDVMEAENL